MEKRQQKKTGKLSISEGEKLRAKAEDTGAMEENKTTKYKIEGREILRETVGDSG